MNNENPITHNCNSFNINNCVQQSSSDIHNFNSTNYKPSFHNWIFDGYFRSYYLWILQQKKIKKMDVKW